MFPCSNQKKKNGGRGVNGGPKGQRNNLYSRERKRKKKRKITLEEKIVVIM